ncbi:hypothetical protein HELRODRAFT_138335, partial [Helobdella robusta]|uniref:PDZ domain-containing protein n=1 Tax=Helobdella robusta TaxID=6412 RepID=T1EIU0_HELRO
PWGFRMAGGKDFGVPLVIQRVNPGSLSSQCGLQEGDTIVQIGGVSSSSLTHREAQDLILSLGNSLELKLER